MPATRARSADSKSSQKEARCQVCRQFSRAGVRVCARVYARMYLRAHTCATCWHLDPLDFPWIYLVPVLAPWYGLHVGLCSICCKKVRGYPTPSHLHPHDFDRGGVNVDLEATNVDSAQAHTCSCRVQFTPIGTHIHAHDHGTLVCMRVCTLVRGHTGPPSSCVGAALGRARTRDVVLWLCPA